MLNSFQGFRFMLQPNHKGTILYGCWNSFMAQDKCSNYVNCIWGFFYFRFFALSTLGSRRQRTWFCCLMPVLCEHSML